jgi:hypothetical protein
MIDTLLAAVLLNPPTDRTPPSSRSVGAARAFLSCVIRHESGGNPHAENPTSTASGLFQFIDGTWRHYAQRVPQARRYGHAAHAPARVQWDVAIEAVMTGGHGHWRGTGCGYGT